MNRRVSATRSRILAALVGVTFLTASWRPARAEDPGAAAPAKPTPSDLAGAKRHYADGEKNYKAGDFAGALAEFTAANDVKAAPQSERYIGLCEDALGHFVAAADWYGRFLAHVPDTMTAAGDEVRKRVSDIKSMPGKVHVESAPPGATVYADHKPATAPTPVDIELPPGAHSIQVTLSGRQSGEKPVDVTFASAQAISFELLPEASPGPPAPAVVAEIAPPQQPVAPPAEPAPRSLVPAYVTGGLAVAATAVGAVFGAIALNDKSNFDKNPTTQTADDGDTHSLVADMAFGVAITFGVTSAVLFLTKNEVRGAASNGPTTPPVRATARRITIVPTPIIGSHSGGGGFLVSF